MLLRLFPANVLVFYLRLERILSYLNENELSEMRFKSLGANVKISSRASIYNPELIEIGDNSRIDDFCVISGNLRIGRNVHITPQCLVAGGEPGLEIEDFVALAYGVKVFTHSDDYSGRTMTNSTVPKEYKQEIKMSVVIGRHSIVGAGSIIMPGVNLGEGTSVGANSLVLKSTERWSVVVGSPAKKIKDRERGLLELEKQYLSNE
ncbi:acyltransferase [Thiomicrorhabdus sp. zzn3]|uniref:acyltransferase n=1 Tax=Thiomicrorhabdus sp. zzn3 TaxID=3039775 RepID=UPI0024363D6A|nr:acyltransferase [Thiomicrorhabdus sp. zzn3]MDG6777366.1 acyltransferase [Thiomicrorhabdus sp. zzn3]